MEIPDNDMSSDPFLRGPTRRSERVDKAGRRLWTLVHSATGGMKTAADLQRPTSSSVLTLSNSSIFVPLSPFQQPAPPISSLSLKELTPPAEIAHLHRYNQRN